MLRSGRQVFPVCHGSLWPLTLRGSGKMETAMPAKHNPVVFVHGYSDKGASWAAWREILRGRIAEPGNPGRDRREQSDPEEEETGQHRGSIPPQALPGVRPQALGARGAESAGRASALGDRLSARAHDSSTRGSSRV